VPSPVWCNGKIPPMVYPWHLTNDSQATSSKPQAASGKPTPGGGGKKAFYKKVLDIRSGII